MADLIVTFGRALSAPPVMDGNPRRTEVVAIGGSSAETSLTATEHENAVKVYAEADCWVAVGVEAAVPDTNGLTESGFLKEGDLDYLKIAPGEKVSVVSA